MITTLVQKLKSVEVSGAGRITSERFKQQIFESIGEKINTGCHVSIRLSYKYFFTAIKTEDSRLFLLSHPFAHRFLSQEEINVVREIEKSEPRALLEAVFQKNRLHLLIKATPDYIMLRDFLAF